jgi:DNA-binding transcriptional LysR family regulator
MSFTKAAYENNISQSTISKQIALLEKELGTELLSRGKLITLTPAGEAIYGKFILMLRELDSVLQTAKAASSKQFGQLNVGMFSFFDMKKALPGFLREFTLKHPEANIRFIPSGRKELQKAFMNKELDCVFLLPYDYEIFESYDLKACRLPRKPHRLVFPRNMFPESYTPTVRDFKDTTFYFTSYFEDQDNVSYLPLDVLAEMGLTPKKCQWLDSFDLAYTYIEEGLGAGVFAPSTRIDSGKYARSINLECEKSYISMSLYWRDTNPNPLLTLFTDMVAEMSERQNR